MIDKIIEAYKEKTKRECYKFEIEEGIEPGIMDDKLGGIPYIPVGEEYPLDKTNNPMLLLVQINLANIDLENYPKEGILEIFIDKEASWPCDYQVRYFKKIKEYRNDLPIVDETYIYEKPLKIKLEKAIEHMPLSNYNFPDVMKEVIKEVAGVELNNFNDIWKYFENNGVDMFEELYKLNIYPGNIGGYADFTQTDPRPIKNHEDVIESLIKVDSNLGHGVMIGDSGIVFSFISPEDLKAGNFENVIVDWDCC